MKIVKRTFFSVIGIALVLLNSCSTEDTLTSDPFVVAFENLSANLLDIEDEEDIMLVYSKTTSETGYVEINVSAENAIYGTDYSTLPIAENGIITLPISQNESHNKIVFYKLNPSLDETTAIDFTISSIIYNNSNIQGNISFLISSTPSLGGSIAAEVGGPNEGNQVYIDLSSDSQTTIVRDSWDLGFYSADDFRVVINGSIFMATKALDETDIDAISEADVSELFSEVAVGTFNPVNEAYIDHPNGDIFGTAISEVSILNDDNKVYLLNLGYEVGTITPEVGSIAVAGEHRGWKKIRILREGNNYILQYADLNDTSHQELIIDKTPDNNFTFFSFNTQSIVPVEPPSTQWDINFTVFTNIIDDAGAYGYSDIVIHNRKGGVTAYSVSTDDIQYDNFTLENFDASSLQEEQRVIGSTWREVMNEDKILIDNIFYIIKDPNGLLYKLKFTALLNSNGERGFPEFKYHILE